MSILCVNECKVRNVEQVLDTCYAMLWYVIIHSDIHGLCIGTFLCLLYSWRLLES